MKLGEEQVVVKMQMGFTGLLVGVLVAALAVATAEKSIKWDKMSVDWETWHTKEELEAGAFLNPLKSSSTRKELEAGAHLNVRNSSHIIGGDVVRRRSNAPYVGSVYIISEERWFFGCTCAIVDTRIVITAAHCTFLEGDIRFPMGVCVSGVKTGRKTGFCAKVTRMKLPARYFVPFFDASKPFSHDIALLKTKRKLVQRGSKARPIRVDLSPSSITARGAQGFVFGFGDKNRKSGKNDGKLRMVDVEWKKLNICIEDDLVEGKNFLCADGNYDGSMGGTCSGDSGGPLVWSTDGSEDPEKHVLVGVLSYGYPSSDNNLRKSSIPLFSYHKARRVWAIC